MRILLRRQIGVLFQNDVMKKDENSHEAFADYGKTLQLHSSTFWVILERDVEMNEEDVGSPVFSKLIVWKYQLLQILVGRSVFYYMGMWKVDFDVMW